MSWEKTKAPGSARDSNSSASERLSLNGLQIAASAMVFIVVPEQLVVDVFETEFRVSCFQFELDISTTDLEQPLPICDVLFSLKYIHNSHSSIREQQLFIWSRRHIISVQKIATRESPSVEISATFKLE